jgi:hypothetical protein
LETFGSDELLDTERGNAMKRDRRLGLDELMIVNPSSSRMEAMYLSDDGTFRVSVGKNNSKDWDSCLWRKSALCTKCEELRKIRADLVMS